MAATEKIDKPAATAPVLGDDLDPLNWSWAQKHTILAIIMSLYFMFTYITTTTVPSFPELQQQYSLTLEQVNWTVAIPALGLSLGPLLWASPADIIGRRPIFVLGTTVALASTVGAALAPNYRCYMAARFFQGLGVSPAANVGLAVVNDVFFAHERGQKLGLWVLAIDQGLLFGPLIGGFVNMAGFRWIQWLAAILFGLILVAELLLLPETLYPRHRMLEERRGRTRGAGAGKAAEAASTGSHRLDDEEKTMMVANANAVVPGDTGAHIAGLGLRMTKTLPFLNVTPLAGIMHPRPYDTILRFVKTFKYAVVPLAIMTYCFGWYWWVLSVVTLVPVAYETYSPQIQGLLYLGLIVGTLLSEVFCSGRLSDWIVIRLAKSNHNQKTAEMRLWLAYPAAVLTAVGMIVWGVSVDRGHHWMVGQVAFALFGAGIQMGNTAVCSYVVDAYPKQSMATMTFYAVMLNMSAFVDPFFIVPWVENVGFTWTFAGHAIITVFFCIPVLAALHRFGPQIREKLGSPTWVNPEFEQAGAGRRRLPQVPEPRLRQLQNSAVWQKMGGVRGPLGGLFQASLVSVADGEGRAEEAARAVTEEWARAQARWAVMAAEVAAEETEWAAVADAGGDWVGAFEKFQHLVGSLLVPSPLSGLDLAEQSPPHQWLGHLGRCELATVLRRKTLGDQEHLFLKLSVSNKFRDEEVGIKR
ncbi:hypothetical protein VTK26DRAFT_8018 [Humicola hyalothermophila]